MGHTPSASERRAAARVREQQAAKSGGRARGSGGEMMALGLDADQASGVLPRRMLAPDPLNLPLRVEGLRVCTQRASLGASQSRLELASTTLQVENKNLSAAISCIRDVDVAEESTQYARYNILVQSGTAMLAQANQTPQSVLKLLQG
jgi:hypothetical protein